MSEGMSSKSDNNIDLLIIGGGLGGLLSAALASNENLNITVVEQLSFLGGRFTAFDNNGYALPSGAVHMIPYGNKGPMGQILRNKLKLDRSMNLTIEPTQHFVGWLWAEKDTEIRNRRFWGAIKAIPGIKRKYYIIKMLKDARNIDKLPYRFSDYLKQRFNDDRILKQFFQAIIGFSLSLELEEVPTKEVFAFLNTQSRFGSPAIPVGGCRAVIHSLKKYILQMNPRNKILLNHRVKKVEKTENGFLTTIIVNPGTRNNVEKQFTSKFVISDIGPQMTVKIASNLIDKELYAEIQQTPVPKGFGLAFALNKSMLDHSGITLTPGYKTLCGLVEPTHIDKSLAPDNKHLMLTHHIIPHNMDHSTALELGRMEIRRCFPNLVKHGKELGVHSFKGEWGVNKTVQGYEYRDIGIDNFWLVGDGSKSEGMIMTEGVADSAIYAINELNKALNKKKK